MLSINTNISSLIAQTSMKQSTDKLNQAIERMTTGFKINHASDNAANYSISTNMTTKLNAYDVATDNVNMGMDLVTTASDTVSLMQDKAQRLRALCTQARNGTYGAQSLDAINAETSAIITEIMRLYNTSEYNGINLFNRKAYEIDLSLPTAKEEYNGFIIDAETKSQTEVESLSSIQTFTSGSSGTYKIMSADDLAELANIVNSGKDTRNATFYLGADIDLTEWQNEHGDWVPIGDYSTNNTYSFLGVFDGNGHVIKNLKINASTKNYQGLFGHTGSSATIKNLGIEGSIKGKQQLGGLVGYCRSTVTNCYSSVDVEGSTKIIGGLIGAASDAKITNCYATGNIKGEDRVGGLVGILSLTCKISNCFATANVSGSTNIGGLVALCAGQEIINSYSASNVSGDSYVGGLFGASYVYRTTDTLTLDNTHSYSLVSGSDSNTTGSLIGGIQITNNGSDFGNVNITNSSALFQDMKQIGSCYNGSDGSLTNYDMTTILSGIQNIIRKDVTDLQIGINTDNSSSLKLNTNFDINLLSIDGQIEKETSMQIIEEFLELLSEKSTMLGAMQNRLESALDSIEVNINSLTSSRSTIRDADIAEVSSQYIQQQILQQASATLLATANQSPSIALQLI